MMQYFFTIAQTKLCLTKWPGRTNFVRDTIFGCHKYKLLAISSDYTSHGTFHNTGVFNPSFWPIFKNNCTLLTYSLMEL